MKVVIQVLFWLRCTGRGLVVKIVWSSKIEPQQRGSGENISFSSANVFIAKINMTVSVRSRTAFFYVFGVEVPFSLQLRRPGACGRVVVMARGGGGVR